MPKGHGRHCINVSSGKTSHLLLKRRNNFPDVAGASPNAGEIVGATVKDIDPDTEFYFAAQVIAQASKKRLALKVTSNLPGGGVDPLDGVLAITLLIYTGPSSPNDTLPISDVPVDYISNPTGP
ncbi:MAG: hypothetical protein L0Y72_09055 [Gemmataceae bacterium]|nr:hypothetical protein [Gemmataceae bacterium]MCI0739179.1 hypothetical protein [Gemmataceae bacterium]